MRRTIGKTITNPNNFHITHVTKQTPFLIQSSSPFSSGSGGGRGRGGGGGGGGGGIGSPFGSGQFDFAKTPGKPDSDESKPESRPSGLGHGRGKPIATDPILPSFSSFVSSIKPAQPGTGRGRVVTESPPGQPVTESRPDLPPPKTPIFVKLQELKSAAESETRSTESGESNLPSSILTALSGGGRGKPTKQPGPTPQIKEENRHVRARPRAGPGEGAAGGGGGGGPAAQPKLSRKDAVKNAVRILSHGGDGEEGEGSGGRGRGRGRGGRGGRGRGTQKGWRERGDRRGRGRGREGGSEEDFGDGLYLGDNADGEKLAKRIGVENMNKLVEGFEEISGNVLPSPFEDAYLDAMDTNFAIEFEPEYLMGEFDRNPDIDEKPPIPLRDALEKMKPFLMAYEGIQSHEEWEEAINEVMERVPLLKEIVDHYSGPDRVTAKQQQEELERVAKTIPESAPDSVKRYANRAVLSLQSNPGWGFDKKCQFMDKLVWEVSQQYK